MNKMQEQNSFKENPNIIGNVLPISSKTAKINGKDFFDKAIDTKSFERNPLAKSVLFECIECGGALVPLSKCIKCQKTSVRICVACKHTQNFGLHSTCEYMLRISQNQKTNENHHMVSKI